MSFWNCIGEFLLFRWLFGSHKHDEAKHDMSDMDNSYAMDDIDNDFDDDLDDDFDDGFDDLDDFLDEQEEYDEMDDDF